MSQLSNQWVDVFAAGDHGEGKGVFTDADLDDIVRNFDPSKHEPPAVIGHPKDDTPAYAWVDAVRRVGDRLQARFKDAVPDFEQAVKERRFPKRSVSLYKTGTGWMLRHVGFLGAQVPQVKGLAEIKFQNEDNKSVSIDFEESDQMATGTETEATLWAKFTEKLDELIKGKKTAEAGTPANFTEAQAKELASTIVADAVKPLLAKIEAQEATFAESKRAATTSDMKTRSANAIAKLKGEGKWVPAFDKLGVPVLFEELAKATETVEFGEADKDGKLAKATPLDLLVTFMEQHKAIVPASAVYTGQQAGRAVEMPKGVNPGRLGVDQNSVQFDELVKAKQKADPKLGYLDAAIAVEAENPQLARTGGATAGAV